MSEIKKNQKKGQNISYIVINTDTDKQERMKEKTIL